MRVGSNIPIPVNIRLISATNRDLQEMILKEEFREDLLYRLNTIHLEIPALRERAKIFLKQYAAKYGKGSMTLTQKAAEKLMNALWNDLSGRRADHNTAGKQWTGNTVGYHIGYIYSVFYNQRRGIWHRFKPVKTNYASSGWNDLRTKRTPKYALYPDISLIPE